jgi:hypothetical protein
MRQYAGLTPPPVTFEKRHHFHTRISKNASIRGTDPASREVGESVGRFPGQMVHQQVVGFHVGFEAEDAS